jgi:FkbM family methyltransferase
MEKVTRFYGQFDPPVDKILYERYFNNLYNGTAIECGAYDGITENCTKIFEEHFNWKTINIEPIEMIYNQLVQNRPESINIKCALSNQNGINTIRNYKHPQLGYNWGNSSISHTDNHRRELEQLSNNTYIDEVVETCTYSYIIKSLNIQELDIFVLDVEGHENEVIDGMYDCNILPKVFVIEHGHKAVGYYDEKLKELNENYTLDFVSNVNSFYILKE